MITGDLDAELARSLAVLAAGGVVPAAAAELTPRGTWRPVPGGDPGSYATAVAFELARITGEDPAGLAAALARKLSPVPWISSAEGSGGGYLTITVTVQALARSAARMVAAGSACANSIILRGTATSVRPWPDLLAALGWQQAWKEQAEVMTGRLAQAAGAATTIALEWERGRPKAPQSRSSSPVGAAVAYFGADAIRYRLARTAPGGVAQLEQLALVRSRAAEPFYVVQHAHADAASSVRWAAELELDHADPDDRLADLLNDPSERELLGVLSWLPVRVAAAARRHRPDEVPRYLEEVAAAWSACEQASPALPFRGPAPAEPSAVATRLLLAEAVRTVVAAGLALAGVGAMERM